MKIVLVGAGSFVFSLSILHDLILDHRASGAELVLVDLDPSILPVMEGVGRRMAAEAGIAITLHSTTRREEALPGADFVIMSAENQGVRRWHADYEIVKRFGMPDQGRENGGLTGLVHGLRSITLAIEIARDMERLCPAATMLDVANPMPRVVTAVNRHTRIPAIGFCNIAWLGYPGYQWLAQLTGRRPEEIDVVTAGLNHFAWLLKIRDRRSREDLLPLVRSRVESGEDEMCRVLARWLKRYGAVGVSSVGHMAEYLPYEPELYYQDCPPFHGTSEERRQARDLLGRVAAGEADWREALHQRSWERPIDVAVALHERQDRSFDILNIPNRGYIAELPEGHVVEVPARAGCGQLEGIKVPALPEGVAAICQTVSQVIELTADAAATGDMRIVDEIIELDPAIGEKKPAHAAVREMIAAHADMLTQFAAVEKGL